MILSKSLKALCHDKVSKLINNLVVVMGAVCLISVPATALDNDTSSAVLSISANSDSFRLNDKNKKDQSRKSKLDEVVNSDTKFRSLHASWGGTQTQKAASLSIPSIDPVTKVDISSYYGYRTDPFRGRRKNHKGLDIRGPVGTPIYATADGFVKTAKWLGSYGRFIELDHGNAIHTRYGHMSKLIVKANQFVKKGELIGLMGSTGRSTGSHLHYEVRIAGVPVNPLSFMASANQNAPRLATKKDETVQAQGGPSQ